MTADFALWWQGRSARERMLLAIMAALLALVLVWLLVVRPLSDALDAAQRRHAAAVVALAEARAQGAPVAAASAVAPSLPIDSLIGRSANEAGFTGARITAQGPARAHVAIDAARAPALFGWIASLEQQGLVVATLRARGNADRTLAMEAVLRARTDR